MQCELSVSGIQEKVKGPAPVRVFRTVQARELMPVQVVSGEVVPMMVDTRIKRLFCACAAGVAACLGAMGTLAFTAF